METLHPGLYIQEIPGNPPVEGVSTSTAAFVGIALKGPVDSAELVTNWNQFVTKYGSFTNDGYLAYAVRNFFENGGTRAYISRVVHKDAGVDASAKSTGTFNDGQATPVAVATISAINDGAWGDNLSVVIDNWSTALKTFDLKVLYSAVQVELFEDVTLADLETYINNVSNYITVTVTSATPATEVLADQTITFTGGLDGITGMTDSDYLGDSVYNSGLHAFDNVDINIVAIPGITATAVLQGIITYVEGRKDCFAILDAPTGKTPTTVLTFKDTTAALVSEYAAFYWPWIYASDPIGVGKSPRKLLPPSGFVAGIYARTDNAVNVGKAPAGTDCVVLGALELEYKCTAGEQDTLNPKMINVIRLIPGSGIIVWGARTLKKGDYTYVPVRRTNIFIEVSLKTNLTWAVFQPNNAALWKRIKSSAGAFLKGLVTNSTIKDGYIICDDTINTDDVVSAGLLYVDVGVANLDPAEFIVFRVSLI